MRTIICRRNPFVFGQVISAAKAQVIGAFALCVLFLLTSNVTSHIIQAAEVQEESPVTLTVRGFTFSGNESIDSDALSALLSDVVGQELTLEELLQQIPKVTRYYRERGFVVARAFLPHQEIVDGIVHISVLEGRFGNIVLDNQSRLRDHVASKYLSVLSTGDLIMYSHLQRTARLLNDLPGVRAQTTFVAGRSVGTSDLIVSLSDGSPWSVRVLVNNHGADARTFQTQLDSIWRNPLGYGDQLWVSLGPLVSGKRRGSISYGIPLGGQGANLSLTVSGSDQRQSLPASTVITTNRSTRAHLSYPLVRAEDRNTSIGFSYERRAERRTISSVLVDENHIARTAVDVQGDVGSTNGPHMNFSFSLARGTLRLAPQDAMDADGLSAKTAGVFIRLNVQGVLRQPLSREWALNLSAQGQLASKNLHASEKMALGGIGGVRAYGPATVSGDQGWLLRADLERAFRWPAWQVSGSGLLFADVGRVQVNRLPWPGAASENVQRLAGIGWGLTLTRGNGSVAIVNAYPVGKNLDPDTVRTGRWWLQVSWQF